MLRQQQAGSGPAHFTQLDELRQPILIALALAGGAVSWFWVIVVANFETTGPLAPAVLMFVCCVSCLIGGRHAVRWRSTFLLLGTGGSLLLGSALAPSPVWLYYQSLVVTVAGLLRGPSFSFRSALLLTAGTAALAPSHMAANLAPLGLLWMTAVASWLASRNLYTALNWAIQSQAQAQATASEVQRRRGQLRSTLDSLRTAHAALARTNQELEIARRDAEEARLLKTEFAANISHELRTPLSLILGFTEIMSRSPEVYKGARWTPTLRRDVNEIRRNARYLSDFVDDILDLAHMDAFRMTIRREPTQVAALIEEAVGITRRLLKGKPVVLRAETENSLPELMIDRVRIRQVLINLLTNACRFTEQGTITVSAYRTGEEVVVAVADTGPGIPEEELERVFDQYHQVAAWRSPEDRGKGLGLAIAKGLLQLHGGRIWADSEVGKGSTFRFTLPIVPKSDGRLRAAGSVPRAAQRPSSRVLLLDQDQQTALYLRRRLDGIAVSVATDAAEARALAEREHPDAVVVNLPPETDFPGSVLRELSLPEGVPVIGCTLPSWHWVAESERFAGYLAKPVSSERLLAVVQSLAPSGRVMVVDDDRGFVQFVQRTFETVGQQGRLSWAYDVAEALDLMRQQVPALLLLDLVLPGRDGFALADMVRGDERLAHVPIVVVSGASLGEEAVVSRGDTFILTKPAGFQGEELIQLLRNVLSTVKARYVSGRGTSAMQPATGVGTPAFSDTP
ncbi:MAG: response regulator [Anaerolineae bacterium]|nr:response regulator [Anaerolineae bacterium]